MSIIIKHTLKNIFKNFFRSFVLIICVMVTCITAFLTLDMSRSIENIFVAYAADMLGNVDIEISSNRNMDPQIFENLPETNVLSITPAIPNKIATRDPKHYSYEYVQPLNIIGFDIENAVKLEIFKEKFDLDNEETAISETYAKTFGYNIGDTVSLMDDQGNNHEFIVKIILEEGGVFIKENAYTAVVNNESFKKLLCKDELKYNMFFVDVVKDKDIDTICEYFKNNYPDYTVVKIKGDDEIKSLVGQLVSLFSVLFVLTFLMVIFVTVSLSEKIVNERMSVIGTLRSLGISRGVTASLLLIENIFYGVVGFAIASLIYHSIRVPMFTGMFSVSEGNIPITDMPGWINLVVLGGAIIVECFIPALELTKAVKVAIRDIIFSNKDSDYKFSRKRTIIGGVLLGIGVIAAISNIAVAIIISIVLIVIAFAMIMPEIFKIVSKGLIIIFNKVNFPIAELASIEMRTKKSTVSNSILCFTISALVIALLATANGLFKIDEYQSYDADLLAFGLDEDLKQYKFIEDIQGVDEVYFIKSTSDELRINGNEKKISFDITGFPDTDMLIGIPDLPDSLANDECVISSITAKKLGIALGDEIEIVFKEDFLFPITKSFKVVALSDSSLYESIPLLVISEDLYTDIYHNEFSGILLRCQDSEMVKNEIKKHSLDQSFIYYTREEYDEETQQENDGVKMAVIVAIGFGILLSVIGLSGNQVLGFESRKRELAVLYSSSMTRKQIARLIYLETFLSVGCSVIIGTLLGCVLTLLIGKTTYALDIPLPIGIDFIQYLEMTALLIFIMVITSLKPVRLLKKMKISEQLKYE